MFCWESGKKKMSKEQMGGVSKSMRKCCLWLSKGISVPGSSTEQTSVSCPVAITM